MNFKRVPKFSFFGLAELELSELAINEVVKTGRKAKCPVPRDDTEGQGMDCYSVERIM